MVPVSLISLQSGAHGLWGGSGRTLNESQSASFTEASAWSAEWAWGHNCGVLGFGLLLQRPGCAISQLAALCGCWLSASPGVLAGDQPPEVPPMLDSVEAGEWALSLPEPNQPDLPSRGKFSGSMRMVH